MGLLDWLTSDIASMGTGPSPGAMSNPMGDMTGVNPMTAPPNLPPLPPASGDMPPASMAPPPPSGDMPPASMAPQPVPQIAAPQMAPSPMVAQPVTSPAGPPMSLVPPAAPEGKPNGDLAPTTFLGRALGLDANRERSVRGSLAAGLKSVGANSNKPGLAAFAGSMGSGMEGGQQAEDKGYDQRLKALQLSVTAQAAGDKAAYNKHYATYLGAKLQADGERASSKAAGKSGAWNKPDSQKFIDAQNAMAKDPDIRASQKILEGAIKAGDPKEIAAAQQAHAALTATKNGQYLAGVGLDPKKMADLQKNPPGTPANPHQVTSKEDFNIYVKPGQAYVNPADGKTYIRKMEGGAGAPPETPAMPGGEASPTLPPGPAPATMSMPPNLPPLPAASDDEE